MITLHKNSDRTSSEKDIRIILLKKNIGEKLRVLEFNIPKKIPCKMSNPNATYSTSYSIEFNSQLTSSVWVDATDIDFMFDSFYLATHFTINRYLKATNRWDGENKVMYVNN